MLQRWQILGAGSVVSGIAAEALNIVVPDQLFIQWVLLILCIVCFIVAITAWDQQKQSRDDEP